MIRRTMEFRSEHELVAAEQAIAMVRELEALAGATPDGRVLAVVESAAVDRGRRFVRDRLQAVLNAQAEALEQKGGAPGAAPATGRRKSHGQAERRLVTAAGEVTLRRRYLTCRRCAQHAHPLDERLGVDGLVSPHAQRLLCAAGAEQSFERAARLLRELAGLQVCDNTVRRVCDEHGGRMRAWQREGPEAGQPFRAAEGEVEFQTDGTCANTVGGWREVRLSIFAKRPRGKPVTDLDAWDRARLPAPTARVATAAIRTSAALGPQWRRAAARLGIKRSAELTVLADGARWIWAELEKNLPGAAGVLDVYHASEHLHAAAAARGVDAATTEAWYRARRRTLLESGAAGLLEELAARGEEAPALAEYLGPHADHTPYRARLAEGRSIGSGMVEGACKTAIGRRLKQTGARWRVRRLERMAALCCLVYSEPFDAYWKKATG